MAFFCSASLRKRDSISMAAVAIAVGIIIYDSHIYEISFNQDEYSAYNIIQKLSEYLPIVDFSLREPSVEQVVKKIYNGEIEREFEV